MKVIMPVYIQNEETLELTKSAIHSFGDNELIIIDNDSILGGGYLRSVAAVYIRNNKNLGYAKAVNQGLKLSDRPVAIANNDIRVSPNWLEVAKHIHNGQVGTLHFRMTDYDVPFEYGTLVAFTGMERWCTGSFFVLNCDMLFDENFLNSYDDWDLSRRIRQKGLKTVYTDKACYQHNHSFTQKQIIEREINNFKNREYFKTKWGDYAEVLFEKDFPEQMKKDYRGGFDI